MPEAISAKMQNSFQRLGNHLSDYLRWNIDIGSEALKFVSRGEGKVAEALGDMPGIPIMGKRFYYEQEVMPTQKEILERLKEGEITPTEPELLRPREEVFLEALTAIGVTEPEKKAKEIATMEEKEAYEAIHKLSPQVAEELREKEFRKGGFGGSLMDEYKLARDEAISFFYKLIRDPAHFLDPDPTISGDEYREAVRQNRTYVNLEAPATGVEHALFKGFIEQVPVANDFIQFTGSGVIKIQQNLGLTAMQGLGSLTALILQLLSIQRVVGPHFQGIQNKIAGWTGSYFENATRVTPLMKAGQSLVHSLAAGMEFGTSYATMTALSTAFKNTAEDKTFDTQDLLNVVRSFELGTMIGGISKYWFLQHGLPPPLTKAAEEVEQSIVVVLQNLRSLYETHGDISKDDFWELFVWELFEVPAENLIPIILGMGNLGSVIGYRGQVESARVTGVRAKMRALKARMPDATRAELYDFAIRRMDQDIDDITAKIKEKTGKERPLNAMEVKGLFRGYDKEAVQTKLPKRAKSRAIVKEMAGRPILRRMYRVLVDRQKLEALTKQDIIDLFHDPETLEFNIKEAETVDDMDFLAQQIFEEISIMKNMNVEIATDKKQKELIRELNVGLRTLMELPGQTMMYGKPVVGPIEKKGEIIERAEERVLKAWTEARLNTVYDPPLKFNELYDYEVAMMLDEINFMKTFSQKAINEKLYNLVHGSKGPDEYVNNLFDAVRGLPILMGQIHQWDDYMAVRGAYNKYQTTKRLMKTDLVNIMRKRLGRRMTHDRQFRIMTHGLVGGKGVDEILNDLAQRTVGFGKEGAKDALRDTLEELHAYMVTDLTSPYLARDAEGKFIGNDWNIKEGIRLHMGISESLTMRDYFPYIMTVATEENFDTMTGYINNPHDAISKIHERMKTTTLDEWIKNPNSGWGGLDTYLNRGLRSRYLSVPLGRFVDNFAKKRLPASTDAVIKRWVNSMRARPLDADKEVGNFIKSQVNKLPGVNIDTMGANRLINTIFSMIYAGGLGLKMSAAIKNATQGPMNNPPGMSTYWWMKGLWRTWTDPTARTEAWDKGILRTVGVPVLSQEIETTFGNVLRQTLFLFTFVDHYVNRLPIYWGARMQFENYLARYKKRGFNLVDTVRRIGRRQEKGIMNRWMELAKEGEGALRQWEDYGNVRGNERYEEIVQKIADEYGFLQQANSNWEYGKLGRPSIWGTEKGKFMGQFMTWPTWYVGTYLPSLVQKDFWGLIQHLGKGLLLILLFKRFFGMNLQPWILSGAFPMRPYGPAPQMLFNTMELLKAVEYGHEEWQTEAWDELKRSLLVGIPGIYGVTDFIKLMRDLSYETPYVDEQTGLFHYSSNSRKAWSDFMGVTDYYIQRNKMLELLRQGEYEAANQIGQRWGIKRGWNGSYRVSGLRGMKGL